MKWLLIISVCCLTYSGTLFARADAEILLTCFNLGDRAFPKLWVWLGHAYACLFFAVGGFLLAKGYASGRHDSVTIWGVERKITPATRGIAVKGILATVLRLLNGISLSVLPDAEFRASRVELGVFAVLSGTVSVASSIWTSRRL
jgi:hypothetical protein